MKPSGRLTLRFISYFTVFYLLIIIGVIASILFSLFFFNNRVGDNIHMTTVYEVEDTAVEIDGQSIQIADYLEKRAEGNLGQMYLLDKSMKVLDYTGDNCELCEMTDSEILTLERAGMQTWKLPKYYLLFLPNSPVQPLFEETLEFWQEGEEIPSALIRRLAKNRAAVEIYDEHWKREKVIGEKYKLLSKPELLEGHYDIFENKEELIQKATLKNGSILVIRMPNPSYKPFEEPFNKAMTLFVAVFIGAHIILLVGVIFLSLGISRQFVRPLVYVLSRIERFAQFDYQKVIDKKIHHQKDREIETKI